jgi:hypothetical protein
VHAFAGSHLTAQEELAFLANTLAAGGGIQDRALTPRETTDLVAATCNLGLENWPSGWRERDLIAAFQVGWTVVHRDLCRHAANVLIEVLPDVHCDPDTQWSLRTLRQELIRHLSDGEPWRARPALDAILVLDAEVWAVLRALLAECPAMHVAVQSQRALRVDPDAVIFVARNSEIAAVRSYLTSLTARFS